MTAIPPRIVFTNDKGGVGKSTLAQVCYSYVSEMFSGARAIEFDQEPYLQRLFPGLPVTCVPPAGDGGEDDAIWQEFYGALTAGTPLVADFGAQTWGRFAARAERRRPAAEAPCAATAIVVPVTADPRAFAGALRIVRQAPTLLPGARLWLLACDKDGAIALARNAARCGELVSEAQAAGARFRRVRVMDRTAYPLLSMLDLSIEDICRMEAPEVAARTGLPAVHSGRTIASLRDWMHGVTTVLAEIVNDTVMRGSAPQDAGAADFDEDAYLRRYPDVAEAVRRGMFASGHDHYREHGRSEGREATLRAKGVQGACGPARGPAPAQAAGSAPPVRQIFDEQAYLVDNPDVARAVAAGEFPSGYAHYVSHGRQEGRPAVLRPAG